jgi:hypothetical protein
MDNNDTSLRDVLLSGLEPSDELRDRFEKQVEQLICRPLTTVEKWSRMICVAVFLPMSAVFNYVVYFLVTVADPGLSLPARLLMGVGFSLGCLVFLVGALYAICELVWGRVARRDAQQMMVAISAGFVLMLGCAYMVFWDMLALSVASAIKGSFVLLFYWIMAVGFVVFSAIRWQREDVLLEQKRTQLEIVLLREATSK